MSEERGFSGHPAWVHVNDLPVVEGEKGSYSVNGNLIQRQCGPYVSWNSYVEAACLPSNA